MLLATIKNRADEKRAPKERSVDAIPIRFQKIVNDPYIDKIELAVYC
jgi:hypothetical protein